jgi:hypothetical protein
MFYNYREQQQATLATCWWIISIVAILVILVFDIININNDHDDCTPFFYFGEN